MKAVITENGISSCLEIYFLLLYVYNKLFGAEDSNLESYGEEKKTCVSF